MTRWVLLRGWARESAHWGDFPAQLRRALAGIDVARPDVPGNGARHGERSPASIHAIVDAVRGDPSIRGKGPVAVLGLSMGGMAALAWAHRHPREVTRLVLVNTSARPFARLHERLQPRSYAGILRAALAWGDPAAAEPQVFRLTSALRRDDSGIVARWIAIARARPVSRANLLRQLAAAARYRAPLAGPPVPTLVLSSRGDRLVDPRCSQRLADEWQVPSEVHPDAGHDLPLDDGEWVAAQVKRWLLQPPPRS